jgi:hypothetical protein
MSVNSVTAIGPAVLPAKASTASADSSTARTNAANALVQVDEVTREPIPPRYPWLSRLARELEPVSKQPSPYGSAPPLGETLNQQA